MWYIAFLDANFAMYPASPRTGHCGAPGVSGRSVGELCGTIRRAMRLHHGNTARWAWLPRGGECAMMSHAHD